MLPLTNDETELDQLMEMCNGFLFTGGHDVSPDLYGEVPLKDMVTRSRHMIFRLIR